MSLIKAFMLSNLAIGKSDAVIRAMRRIPEIKMIASTTGMFDLIVLLQVSNLEELHEVISNRIHGIDGIVKTETQVIIKEIEESSGS